MPMTFLTLVLLSAAAYRVGRFLSLDSLIEGTRERFALFLQKRESLVAFKVLDLLTCPWCMTIWTGLGATLFWSFVLADWPGWWFPVYWMAVSTGAVTIWAITDSD